MPHHRELTDLLLSVERMVADSSHQSAELSIALGHVGSTARAYLPARNFKPPEPTPAQLRWHAALEDVAAEIAEALESLEDAQEEIDDDTQLANVDLQNVLRKQQQTLQMMSAIGKLLDEMAMAIVRKIGD